MIYIAIFGLFVVIAGFMPDKWLKKLAKKKGR